MKAQDFGATIRRRRKTLGITQQDLADLVDVSRRTVSELERGVGGTSLKTIVAVCDALGLDVRLEPRTGRRAT